MARCMRQFSCSQKKSSCHKRQSAYMCNVKAPHQYTIAVCVTYSGMASTSNVQYARIAAGLSMCPTAACASHCSRALYCDGSKESGAGPSVAAWNRPVRSSISGGEGNGNAGAVYTKTVRGHTSSLKCNAKSLTRQTRYQQMCLD